MSAIPLGVLLAFSAVSIAGLVIMNRASDPVQLAAGGCVAVAGAIGAFLTLTLWVMAAPVLAQAERRTLIDVEFVVLIGAIDRKPLYVNPRHVAYIAPHEDGITRIGFIGGAVRSVLMGADDVAAQLMEPPVLAKGYAP